MSTGVFVSLIGSLEDVSFPDILQVIHLSRQTGSLVLKDARGERRVRFKNGLVCGATLGEGGPELEDLLVRKGLVAPAALDPARAHMAQSGETLAGALIALGAVSQETVERVVRDEICSTICRKGNFVSISIPVHSSNRPGSACTMAWRPTPSSRGSPVHSRSRRSTDGTRRPHRRPTRHPAFCW